MSEKTRHEEFRLSGGEVLDKVKALLHEGNIRRLILKNEEGRTLLEIPLAVGLVGVALLPILDDFERALKAVPAEVEDKAFREYAKGMDLIYQRLLDSLTKLGLEPVEAVGQPFDPNVHNGIQREERDDVEDHTVLEEYQRGYRFKGRLLRPAMVKVAVRP